MATHTQAIILQENEQADWIIHRDMLINQLLVLQGRIDFADSQVTRLENQINNLKLNSHNENSNKNVADRHHNRSEQK
ncbi:MAG: hypothetical protein GOVbin3171_2 [Prokaryotic dsDNA virus sp.]|mgnify:FL=1|nr:MAG: hypothetical protein GOVbin3171_2 [Prokaryotic dsDNA virus sp.]|tara:strand:+ start:1274 stop:1507 length:234 start_codon:yes stop_codon:yes gene_type:complete